MTDRHLPTVAEAREALDESLSAAGLYNLRSMGAEYGVIEKLIRALIAESRAKAEPAEAGDGASATAPLETVLRRTIPRCTLCVSEGRTTATLCPHAPPPEPPPSGGAGAGSRCACGHFQSSHSPLHKVCTRAGCTCTKFRRAVTPELFPEPARSEPAGGDGEGREDAVRIVLQKFVSWAIGHNVDGRLVSLGELVEEGRSALRAKGETKPNLPALITCNRCGCELRDLDWCDNCDGKPPEPPAPFPPDPKREGQCPNFGCSLGGGHNGPCTTGAYLESPPTIIQPEPPAPGESEEEQLRYFHQHYLAGWIDKDWADLDEEEREDVEKTFRFASDIGAKAEREKVVALQDQIKNLCSYGDCGGAPGPRGQGDRRGS